jgi:hypothetical protein
MASFCKACGTELSPGAAFCEECGKPVAAGTPQTHETKPAATEPAPPFRLRPGLARWAAIAAVLVIAGGTGLFFMLRETPLPEGDALAKLLDNNELTRTERTCLKNFDYSKSPVNVANRDNGTKEWLDFLVRSGIYTGPRQISQTRGFFYEELWQYEHAEGAAKAIKGKRLCFASGLAVDRVEYREIQRKTDYPIVVGKVIYHYANQAPWSKTEEARRLGPEQLAESNETQVFLRLKDGQWQAGEPTKREINELNGNTQPAKSAKASNTGPGMLDGLFSLFKARPESGILGKWRASNSNSMFGSINIEFNPETLLLNGVEVSATYRQDDEKISVIDKDSNTTVMTLEVISSNKLRLHMEGLKFILERVS